MTHQQLAEWLDYMRVEPFGTPADDFRMASLAYLNALAHTDPKQHHKLKFEPFLPNWTGEKAFPTPEQYKLKTMAAHAAAAPKNLSSGEVHQREHNSADAAYPSDQHEQATP